MALAAEVEQPLADLQPPGDGQRLADDAPVTDELREGFAVDGFGDARQAGEVGFVVVSARSRVR